MPYPQSSRHQVRPPQSGNGQRLDEPKEDKPKPDKWWKWLLLYPTLGISILSSIPTYIELVGSMGLNVPFGQYKAAMKESELWKENIECAAAPFDGLTNKHNVAVDAVVCQSGNVLVRVKPPEKKTAYKWVPLEVAPERVALNFVGSAYAQTLDRPVPLAQANFFVLCQQWMGNGMIRRRISNRNAGRCFDEVVNTYNGQVLSTNPAPCNC
jgi:hypothetical protein